MENRLNYYKIERDEWSNFYQEHIVPLTEEELLNLKSLNDQISLKDVQDIYMPLVHLLRIHFLAPIKVTISLILAIKV